MPEQEEGTHHFSPSRRQKESCEMCFCMQKLCWPFLAKFQGFTFFFSHRPHMSSPDLEQKTAPFIQKRHCSLGVSGSQCSPELRSEILPRYLPSAPLRQPRRQCARLRAARWRTLGNEAQLGLTGKETGWHNSPIPPSPSPKALSFDPFSFHLPVWHVCQAKPRLSSNELIVEESWPTVLRAPDPSFG